MKQFVTIIVLCLLSSQILKAQNNLTTKTIANNLDTPWEILWGSDNFIWATERFGRISRINPNSGEVLEVISIDDSEEVGEGGLLGMVIDSDFLTNNFFYVAYNYFATGNDYREKIVRFTYNPSTGKAGNPFILLDNINAATNHNGCRLVISPDNKLIFTTGDAQLTSNSQDINNMSGKTLRINLDGTIPNDNPVPNNRVWTWGHRNPQGLVYSPDGKYLYSSEHGSNSNDEINIITKGRNYGWPNVEGFCDNELETAFCRDSNVVEPIFAWTPTLAVAGIDFYNYDLIPEWKNSILVSSLKASRITQLHLNESGTEVLNSFDFYTNEFGRLRDICISPEGKVYVAVSNKDGRGTPNAEDDRIIEISPVSTSVLETEEGISVNIFPNPSKDFINITLSEQSKAKAFYKLINLNGQVLKSGYLESLSTKLKLPADYNGLAILQLNIDDQFFIEKVLIQK